jgi:DNA invertase Pin-like site-specific DNA recombinase
VTRIRGYIRESTAAQGEKFGPDAQRAAILEACRSLELAAPAHWYTDLISGTGSVVRDALAAARTDARAHEYDVLICYDTSRWARNEREAFDFEHEMKIAGVRIYYAAERIWADDDATALHKGVLHVINAEYSRALSRRIRDGYAAKRAKGQHVGSIPWGYRRVDAARLEPTERVQIRILAWQLYASGDYTFATLAQELNRRGHRIDYRGRDRAFTRFTLSEILRSRVDLELGGLAAQTFERAREVRARHLQNEHVGQRRHEYVFAGVARCAQCGETYWGRMQAKSGKPSRRQLVHAPRGCGRGARDEELLERTIGAWLSTWSFGADARTRIARFLRRSSAAAVQDRERTRALRELERLQNLYRWGDLEETLYRAESSRVRERLAALGPGAAPRPSDQALKLASRIGLAWDAAALPARRAFVREWIAELRIRRDGIIDVVPRPAVAAVVYAAQGSGTVGDAGRSPAVPHPVRVVGLEEWRRFWADAESA